MTNPTAGMLVIGDEILSGRTRDSNAHHLACQLTEAGIDLSEVRMIPDDQERIVESVNALRKAYDHVFTSGGIGPTHDDITADSIALAFGVSIDIRSDARSLIEEACERYGTSINAARLRMARIPDGATLIENPVSSAPGFSLENVHVMAGVPKIFEAMLCFVIPRLTAGHPPSERVIDIARPEGEIAGPLGDIAASHSGVSIGSYPRIRNGMFMVSIVLRGKDRKGVDAAADAVIGQFPDGIEAG